MKAPSRSSSFKIVSIVGILICVALGLFRLSPPAEEPVAELTESELSYAKETAKGVNDFAIDMYLELAKSEKGNIFFAPQNISAALAMAYAGASGENAREIARVMHFGPNVHKGMGLLERRIESTNNSKSGPRVWTANAIWPLKNGDLKLAGAFEKIMKNDYRAQIQMLDYARNLEGSRETINGWVEKKTVGRIKELISRNEISKKTKMVLTSATYFGGKWATPFDKSLTRKQSFYLTNDKERNNAEKTTVNLMRTEADVVYEASEEAQMISMPYAGDQYAMIFVLPQPGISLMEYEKKLRHGKNREQLQRLIDTKNNEENMIVYIPKFRMNKKYNLKPLLANLGMREAFVLGGFQKMMIVPSTGRSFDLIISNVIHQTFIELDEEKTEAAAATAVIMGETAPPNRKKAFRADRPFIYLLVHKPTGTIIFMGRFVKPE